MSRWVVVLLLVAPDSVKISVKKVIFYDVVLSPLNAQGFLLWASEKSSFSPYKIRDFAAFFPRFAQVF